MLIYRAADFYGLSVVVLISILVRCLNLKIKNHFSEKFCLVKIRFACEF